MVYRPDLSIKRGGGVYLLRHVDGRLFKIGVSRQPKGRRRAIRNSGKDAALLHVIPSENPFKLERWLHKKFKEKHHEGFGGREWFQLEPADVVYILGLMEDPLASL